MNPNLFRAEQKKGYEVYWVDHPMLESMNEVKWWTFVYFFIPGSKGMMTQGFQYLKMLYESMAEEKPENETWLFEVYNFNFNNEFSATSKSIIS